MLRGMWARLLGSGGVLRARGNRLTEVDRLEDGLGVIEDGRFGDLLDVVREEGLGACAKGAVGGAVGADVPAGPFGKADALLCPLAPMPPEDLTRKRRVSDVS